MKTRELTRDERAAIRKLVTKMCANYDREYGCLPLDCPCYMLNKWWTGSYCRYFQSAVLPLDPVLEAVLLGYPALNIRRCEVCGAPFHPKSNRAKYCGGCAKTVHRRQKAESERKRRANVDN